MNRAQISRLEVFEVNVPFRVSFKHSAATRVTSESVFVKCVTDQGEVGFGEALPRVYVTGESQRATYDLLADTILPRLLDRGFSEYAEVEDFLATCDGRAPAEWVAPAAPQGAAWCAVDLALLDAFGKAYGKKPFPRAPAALPEGLRYSAVLSAETGGLELPELLLGDLQGDSPDADASLPAADVVLVLVGLAALLQAGHGTTSGYV